MRSLLIGLALVVVVVVVAAIVWFWMAFPLINVRYRLTVEVQDGDQIKSGSGIIEVSYQFQPDVMAATGGYNGTPRYRGYAITVDLGEKGLLFLTFQSAHRTPAQQIERNRQLSCPLSDIGCLVFAAYDKPGTDVPVAYSEQKAALSDVLRKSGPRDVPFAMLPLLMRFMDIQNPSTARDVAPYDLAGSYGPGVALKRVILELTNDPITPPPNTWPRWFLEKGGQYDGILKGYQGD